MTEQENRKLIDQYAQEVWTNGKLEAIDDYLADNFEMGYPFPGVPPNKEGYKQFAGMMRSAFPDLETTIVDTFASGNQVTQRWRAEGTHEGELMGTPATGEKVNFNGVSVYEVEDGEIVRDYTIADMMTMMQQLGLAPEMG